MSPALKLRVEALEKKVTRVQKILEEDKVNEHIFLKYFGYEYQTGNRLFQNRLKQTRAGRPQQQSRQVLDDISLEECSEFEKTCVVFDYNHGKSFHRMSPTNNCDLSRGRHQDRILFHSISQNPPTMSENSKAVPNHVIIEYNHREIPNSAFPQSANLIQENEQIKSASGTSSHPVNNEVNGPIMAPDYVATPMDISAEFLSTPDLNIQEFTQDTSFQSQTEDPTTDSNDPPSVTLLSAQENFKKTVQVNAKIITQNKFVQNSTIISSAPIIPEKAEPEPPTNTGIEEVQQEPMEEQGPQTPAEEDHQSSDDSNIELSIIITDRSKKLPAKRMIRTRAACRRKNNLPEPGVFLPPQPTANENKPQINISKFPVRPKRKHSFQRKLKIEKVNRRSHRIRQVIRG